MKTRTVKLGVVGVDSAQIVICDPSYIRTEFKDDSPIQSSGHTIHRHKEDNSLWKIFYEPVQELEEAFGPINKFPGSYETVIPKYGKTPNQLVKEGLFIDSGIDPQPHINKNEFSMDGIHKLTSTEKDQGGQLNYLLGHPGVAVVCRSGFGDGCYDVFAELVETGSMGERVKKVWVEFITDKELKELEEEKQSQLN